MPNYSQSFPSEQQKLKDWLYFATDENWEEILANDTLFCFRSLDPRCTQKIKKEDWKIPCSVPDSWACSVGVYDGIL